MSEKVLPVVWNGEYIGTISDPKVDNFDLYGKWTPNPSAKTEEFLALLEEGEQLEVQVGNNAPLIRGTIEVPPSLYIEIKMRQ